MGIQKLNKQNQPEKENRKTRKRIFRSVHTPLKNYLQYIFLLDAFLFTNLSHIYHPVISVTDFSIFHLPKSLCAFLIESRSSSSKMRILLCTHLNYFWTQKFCCFNPCLIPVQQMVFFIVLQLGKKNLKIQLSVRWLTYIFGLPLVLWCSRFYYSTINGMDSCI